MKQRTLEGFYKAFGVDGEEPRLFFSPGRVNIIGEHIDYNGGLVMPCALNLGTYAAIRRRNDATIRLKSGNIEPKITITMGELEHNPAHLWANYPKAVVALLVEERYSIRGFDMFFIGDLPNGAGLSSSASITTLTALALDSIFNLGTSPIERVKLCQRAEAINGVHCGVMDFFACTMGKKDHAILLDCAKLKYSYIPLNLGDYRLVLANTNHRRELMSSMYNTRREECEQALEDLQKVCKISNLCELSVSDFEKHAHIIRNDVIRWRAQHVITEHERVKTAAKALSTPQGLRDEMIHIMMASHLSLRNHFEVVGVFLDELVKPAFFYGILPEEPPPLLGTRMTGAGFGGCTVNIVHKNHIERFIKHVGTQYKDQTGIIADFYVTQVGDGAREI